MYRRKFRESKCQDRETYVQLVARMEQYLERWISLSNISKDFNSLFDFLIREQLLSNCNSDMRIFLKEREFVTAVEMAESADRFRSAHLYRGKRTNQTPIFKATQSVKEGVKLPTEPYPPDDPSLPVPDKADLPPSILPNHLDAKDPSSLIHPETSSPILTLY
nr:uncharacterized protein LOC113805405 [Penaeus vannamei]